MKTKKIIGGFFVLSLMAFAIAFLPALLSKINKEKTQDEREPNESFNDAAKYLFSMRVNPSTGRIDLSEVEAARNQVEAMAGESRNERMKSGSFNFNWQELGPDNIGGRTRAILFDKANPDKMFAGSVSGGLWKSINHGQSWYPVSDTLQNLGVSCITQAQNGDIYFGTGNGFDVILGDGNSGFYGQGIWKSTDGGTTFHRLDSTWTTATQQAAFVIVNNICADPNNANRIYAATQKGLRMTNNGGLTWINPVRVNMTGVVLQSTAQTVKVASDGTVLCSVGGQLYISPNGNDSTFTKITNVPTGYRIEVAIAPSNPNVMYAVVINGSSSLTNIYRSTDKFQTLPTIIGPGGGGFDPYVETGSNQGGYDCAIAVAPDNQDKIFAVGITAWTWTLNHNWVEMNGYQANTYIHPDMHTVVFNPNDPNDFFIGTDGGLFETKDQGLTFAAMNRKYNVTQFYACSPTFLPGSSIVIGGAQDNGSLAIVGNGNNPQDAFAITGGDGFYTSTSYYNPNAFFAEVYYGAVGRSSNASGGGAQFYDNNIDHTAGAANDSAGHSQSFAPFCTAYLLWENTQPNSPLDTSFFIGLNSGVWMTKGALDFNKTPKWYKVALTQFPTRCMGVTNDGKTLFVGTENMNGGSGIVYRITGLDYVNNSLDTSNGNYNVISNTPIKRTQLTIAPNNGQVPTSISVDPSNNNHVVVTYGNYGSAKHVFQSHNALQAVPTWTDITPTPSNSSFPINMPVYSSMIDRWDSTRILVGTELGVFASNNSGTTWTYQDQLPRVPTLMIKQVSQYTNGMPAEDIYIATHGRGIWKSSTLTGIPNNPSLKIQFSIYPNPAQDVTNINFTLSKSSNVSLDIYNIQCQKVKTLNFGIMSAGAHTNSINVSELSNGTYFMNATMGEEKSTSKFVIVR